MRAIIRLTQLILWMLSIPIIACELPVYFIIWLFTGKIPDTPYVIQLIDWLTKQL